MSLTGPILPKAYGLPNADAPTPTTATSITNEIITCTRTGRMWVNWRDLAMVPVRPEFSFTNLSGETLAGVRSTLFGVSPFESCGVEIYGGGLKVGRVEATGDVISTATVQCAAFTMNSSSTFNVTTSSAAANPIHLRALKPTLSNDGTTATGANKYWFSVTNSLGCEFGDSGGAAGAYRLNALISGTKAQFERVIEANDGLRITDLTSVPSSIKTYLTVDGSGNVGTAFNTINVGQQAADQTLTATNTWEELTDLSLSALVPGAYRFSGTITCFHSGNYDVQVALKNKTGNQFLTGTQTSGNGWTSLSFSLVINFPVSTDVGVFVRSTHLPTVRRRVDSNDVPATTLNTERIG